MNSYVLSFREIDKTKLMVVGGKGLNLGELSRIEGIRVPEGFCVTTGAYKSTISHNKEYNALVDQLSTLRVDDRKRIGEISGKIRGFIEEIGIAGNIEEEIIRYLLKFGEEYAYAVRSSATAEDLPLASFAGQQDTYLNIKGRDAILKHIRKCWASLFTDRAVIYRMQNGFDHRKVFLSVVIQRMLFPRASGIMFTADPVISNRKVISIDASLGLGEALVSGLVNADIYKVRDGRICNKTISTKKLAVYALKEGGTEEREIEPEQQNIQTLTDEQILRLEGMGRKIEAFFGFPQDIEWCLYEDTFYVVQSRPITTLYPVPDLNDGQNHIYTSIGHQQMMTDAIKPLGISFFQLLSDEVPLRKAGGRLFFDLTHDLASPIGREIILRTWGKADPLMHNAILNLMKRKAFVKSLPRGKRYIRMGTEGLSWALPIQAIKIYRKNDVTLIQNLISHNEASVRDLQQRIANVSGDELFAFIVEDHKQLKEIMYNPRGMGAIIVGVLAANWINKKMEKWLGEKNVADTLSQSVANNVTSEMGLALLDVSDVVRQYPAVIDYFHHASDETFFVDLSKLEGGNAVSESLQSFLEKYGMRCSGEIDITRPRWSEQPTALIPMILSNIKNFQPNARGVKFDHGRLEAEQKEQDLLSRLEQLPGGQQKAQKTKKVISVLRNFIGYREYPKYAFIQRYYIYKQALLKEAVKLVQKGVIREKEDIYYLSFEELREVARTNRLDYSVITKRKEEYEVYEKLTPPRVMTSEGEVISGEYNTGNIPQGALPGIPVSTGIIEGRARVVLKMADAIIEDGDILVTTFTDPSWTPLFVSVKGLVTEVGGLMTHGAVIAREYGLPAVVSVENATKLIKDGQRIRVNGTEGYVEKL
ncbi:pyruvate phosphate dikinase PEP/pyruvate- binding [Desulfofarcimen acetoxidans DSM 771]|uniref:Rifampicin phosphotransferase n=1 Tax=Desulfofarcimen acetoxidans (strain ATCC 49208 / DSM 771 / KCTC 5769 / VKM B-1644 / 5575) TaxID=485916 RepID=C8W1N5_DESAS|nr:phosphoenolpyruvate synthase [Desulfofarcimen acetoxidans]ACV63506.1 pyruvate phosphate dikinase PEP/pyruvate- binding [Desulfofarcimen acetoxidans DSM 771]